MRNPLLVAAAVAIVSGCQTAPPTDQVPAAQMVDNQIAVSASTISQAQMRLHRTAAPVTTSTAAYKPAAAPTVVLPAPVPPPRIVQVVQVVQPADKPSVSAQVVVDALKPSSPAKVLPSATAVPQKNVPPAPVSALVFAKVTPAPKPAPEKWMLNTSDVTLRRALSKWAAKAGWQLVWDASVDVPINVTATFEGDFRSAVKRLFQSLSAADVNLTGMLYAGNRVLRVTESGSRAQ